ncbi:hypothetical protein [Humibacter sp. RRB41]|uniref:hypothetical protein n=1 Tax=Humibacter sp. RRB41 TaxID=2919946 RepID=UPI001FAA325D|nr:hypothetical protein [Humibacter sp. RRB41]
MSDDTDRDKLANLINKKLDGDAGYEAGWFLADAILAEFLPNVIARVRREAAAEQREKDAQIAASNLDRPWIASETPGDTVRAIREQGTDA